MTKTIGALGFALWISLSGAVVCHAQSCTEAMNLVKFECTFDTCNRTMYVRLPKNQNPIFPYSCDSLDCCGQLLTDCTIEPGDCSPNALRDTAFLHRVKDVAA